MSFIKRSIIVVTMVVMGFVGQVDGAADAENDQNFIKDIIIGEKTAVKNEEIREIRYKSSADESEQPAIFYAPQSETPVPLIVALHTWAGNYKQKYHAAIEKWCVTNKWAYIHPDFRGPNIRPESTGSELVVKDIVSAVEYVKQNANIDDSAIYLVGTSGGGYAALLMAGRHPEIWAGVSAWVPISDLKAWCYECEKAGSGYFKNIVASCGGVPGSGAKVDEEYIKRSPLTYLKNAKQLALHINAGINDGHKGSVPISHSLLAFNEVAEPDDRLTSDQISFFVEKAEVPPGLETKIIDSSYGKKTPLFRRVSGKAVITIFDGGHEIVPAAAIDWIQNLNKAKLEDD